MDKPAHFRDVDALIKRIDDLSAQLIKRYLNILALARVPVKNVEQDNKMSDSFAQSQNNQPDRNAAALNGLKMDVETQGLIRATESLLTLTRQMKELWLFGQLDTLGKSDMVEKTEEDAKAVARMVEELTKDGKLFGGG